MHAQMCHCTSTGFLKKYKARHLEYRDLALKIGCKNISDAKWAYHGIIIYL
jgi:hypothetical protein